MTNFDKLVSKLSELFELEKADLDFGIHRIIKARQKHIRIFLGLEQPATDDLNAPNLQKIVQREMGELNTVDLERQLESVTASIQSDYGKLAFDASGKLADGPAKDSDDGQVWMTLSEQLDSGTAEANLQLEAEIYSHLTEFFSRYYDAADFLSKRRIKAGETPYAVPYSGEEVMLHWANKDQYYIKSSKELKDYTFTLPERFEGKRVQFKCERQDPVLNNNKAKREFHLDDEAEIEIGEEHLVIPFHFKIVDKARTQKDTKEWIEGIVEGLPAEWQQALKHTPDGAATDLITRHLSNYTRKNESDFFIHKHLGKFLRRELDFYIKNEVMHLDDIDAKSTDYLATRVRLIKALRNIARHIITFLAQLENFQKKLWLKKKYVCETQYCISLDRLLGAENGDDLIAVVLENCEKQIRCYDGEMRSQRDEWLRLYCIDKLEDYPQDEKLTADFLKAHNKMMVDTAFYPESFKWQLISSIDDLDESLNGLLIQSDNFQALNLLQERYHEKVKCIYTDPPYNTNASEIIYKNGYKHSSWLTLLHDRAHLAKHLLNQKGIFEIAIDDAEQHRLKSALDEVFGTSNHIANIAIMHNPKGREQAFVSDAHEYTFMYAKNIKTAAINRLPLSDSNLKAKYPKKDSVGIYRELPLRRRGNAPFREDRPYMYFPFIVRKTGEIEVLPREEYSKIYNGREFDDAYTENLNRKYKENQASLIWPIRDDGSLGRWRWGYDRCLESCEKKIFFVRGSVGAETIYHKDYSKDTILPKSLWFDNRYDASTKGTNVLKAIIPDNNFDYPKSIFAVEDFLRLGLNRNETCLDFFAGSGTTGHAIINLNREDEGSRKYILIEMGEYFDRVTKPRIQKTSYSSGWKKGEPFTLEDGVRHCFKYIRLESYEDALNNLDLGEDRAPDLLGLSDQVREDYLFSYLLNVETRGHLMNLERFRDPWGCQLKIHDPHTGKSEPKVIDLVETFNYLLGVTVREVKVQDGFLTIEGENPSGETVLIVWRKLEGESDWPTTDNTALKAFITERRRINTAATEYHAIYINGDHTLEDPQSKIHCIEEVFYERMFENTGNPED